MFRLISLILLIAINGAAHASKQALSKHQIISIKNQLSEVADIFGYVSHGSLGNVETYLVASYETRADRRNNDRERFDRQESIQRCAVFSVHGNSLTLLAKSGPLISYGPRDGVECAIAWGVVEIQHRNSSSLCSEFNETWKFKLTDGEFTLIGYDSASSDGCKSPVFTESATSVNFLANEARLWRKSGKAIKAWTEKATWNKPYVITKTTKNKEIPANFSLEKPFHLESFDIKTFDAWIKKNKDLCGYIDEHFVYVPCD